MAKGAPQMITAAPVVNHTDAEPPFMHDPNYNPNPY